QRIPIKIVSINSEFVSKDIFHCLLSKLVLFLYDKPVYMLARIWLFLFFCAFALRLAGSPYYFNHFQVNRGLSNNAILCSVQDQDGFIWFGTRDGLNRFDGYRFKNFFHESENEKSLG